MASTWVSLAIDPDVCVPAFIAGCFEMNAGRCRRNTASHEEHDGGGDSKSAQIHSSTVSFSSVLEMVCVLA